MHPSRTDAAHSVSMEVHVMATPAEPTTPEPMLSIVELSTYLSVPVSTLYSLRTENRGPRCAKVGRSLRYRRADVEAWLEQLMEEDAA